MFTVEQRDAVRERVLRLGREDSRVVSSAVVGSLAKGGGDRFSDLDITFSIADEARVADVLEDWTHVLVHELDAVHLVDVDSRGKTYRVFVLAGGLQLDLSMGPASLGDPGAVLTSALAAEQVFGWGVIYAMHANASIARGRLWQAEHYVGAVRDHALTLACLRHGVRATEARGYDDLPAKALAEFVATHVDGFTADGLSDALTASLHELLREGEAAHLPHADAVRRCLGDAASPRRSA